MEWGVLLSGPVSLTIELNRPLSWDVPRAVNWALALWALATAFKECWDHPKPNRGSKAYPLAATAFMAIPLRELNPR